MATSSTSFSTGNIIRLTDNSKDQSRFVLSPKPFASKDGLSVTFDFYSYGGSGGDGFSFFFVNAAAPLPTASSSGGSLGYAPRINPTFGKNEPGLPGGYLGIGFDEFGNYSNPTEGKIGGLGFRADSIAVRGSAETGYKYLTGTSRLPSSLDNPGSSATRDASKKRAKVDLSPDGFLSVQVDLNNDGDFIDLGEQAITNYNVITTGQNGVIPEAFKFGFAGTTGNSTNVHEVGNFSVTTFAGVPVSFDFNQDLLISGGSGTDTLIGGSGVNVITGGTAADRFVFSGATKRAALRSSTLRAMDRITDFRFSEGDRFQLDFDNNLSDKELPKGLFNAGRKKGALAKVLKQVYADKNSKKKGEQALKADESVIFSIRNRTYLSVNDNRLGFSPVNDLVVNITGTELRPGDLNRSVLAINNYFV